MQRINDNAEFVAEPAASDQAGSSELVFVLMHWLRVARYRQKTILLAVAVAAILGAAYYVAAPRYYQSAAKLMITKRAADQMADMDEQQSLDSTMATHQGLITSPVVVQGALEHLLPEHRIDLRETAPEYWNDKLASGLSAKTTRKTSFLQLNYRSLSPEAAAAVVSAVVQSYLGFVEGTHKGTANDVLAGLTHELNEVQRRVDVKQQELQRFRQQVGSLTIRSDDGIVHPTIQKALQLSESLTDAQEERFARERQLEAIETATIAGEDLQPHLAGLEQAVGEQMMVSALGLSAEDLKLVRVQQEKLIEAQKELKALTPFFGPAHPKVAELKEQIQTIENYLASYRANTGNRISSFASQELGPVLVAMLRQSVDQATKKERQIRQSFEAARAQAVSESGEIVDLEKQERDIKRLEKQQDVLVDRIANIDLRQLQAPIQATVVMEPLPNDAPVSPRLRHVVFLSLFCGLAAGGLIVYVQDVLDDRFSSPEEITAQLAVPVLSIVPDLPALDGVGLATVHTHVHANAAESEAFRTLRTALMLHAGDCNRLLVSSAEPGDGKTTVSANLAVSLTQAGRKTLVIDADLRKPGMTALADLKGRPGVADVLESDEPAAELAEKLVERTELERLDILPAGTRRPNPSELLSGPRFAELLAWAETRYDFVLVDCPPVLAVSDAQVIGRVVDGAILVVRPDKNHRRLVVRACENFATAGTQVLGIVANGIKARAGGYGYGYGYGYGHDEQETSPDDVLELRIAGTDHAAVRRRDAALSVLKQAE